jgi:hypothetical protein
LASIRARSFTAIAVDKKNVFEIDGEAARFPIPVHPKHADVFSCNPAAYE